MKRKCRKCRKRTTKPVVYRTLKNGGAGTGGKALIHKGEIIISNPYNRRP